MPCAKKAFSLSELKLSNGRTAMLLSGIAVADVSLGRVGLFLCAFSRDRKIAGVKIIATITSAISDKIITTIPIPKNEGLARFFMAGGVPAAVCCEFLNFSGVSGLPSSCV